MRNIQKIGAEGRLKYDLTAAQNRNFMKIQRTVKRNFFDKTCNIAGFDPLLFRCATFKRLLFRIERGVFMYN